MTRASRARSIAALVALCAVLACDRGDRPALQGGRLESRPTRSEPQASAGAPLHGMAAGVDATDPARSAPTAAPKATEVVRLAPDRAELRERAKLVFGTLPAEVANPAHPATDALVELGRVLYSDARLAKNHDLSCNSCHALDRFGTDGEISQGHGRQRPARNTPTVYNAALQFAQFWDGRASDVEEVAKEHLLNAVDHAMPSEAAVVGVLESIPGYAPLFAAAFPGTEPAIRFDQIALAIGAFERRLLTPSRFDAFLAGDTRALGDAEVRGLEMFLDTGCTTCHQGVGIGGGLYQKLGLVRPYPTEDPGRAAITGNPSEQHHFKVPMLRNVAVTAPYFHDGSVATLDEAIRIMAAVQLGVDLADDRIAAIRAFLESLTGAVDSSKEADF